MPDPVDELTEALYRLAELLLTEKSLSADLQRTVEIAVALVEGCDAGTVSVIVEGTPRTLAVSDHAVLRIDLAQYEAGDGPCLDAADRGGAVDVRFWPNDERYPHAAAAAERQGVTAVQSHPVVLHGRPIGSLNLYSREENGFPREPGPEGGVLAAQIALALEKSALLEAADEAVDEVQHEVERRESVAQATGVLMAVHSCSVEQAHRLMESASGSEQRGISEVAALILSSLRTGAHPLLDMTDTDTDAQRRDVDTD
jgi:GAF domain-containing protein